MIAAGCLFGGIVYFSKLAGNVGVGDSSNTYTYSEHWDQRHKKLENKKEDKVEDKLEKRAIFIPLTWPSKRIIEPYDADSPEWQALLDFSRDQQHQKELMSQLRESVVAAAFNSRRVSHTLGYGNVRVKQTLWIDFPQTLPQEYEWSGLELGGKRGVAWKVRIVDVSRFRRYGLPYGTAHALWSGSYSAAKAYWEKAKRTFNFKSNDVPAVSHSQAPSSSATPQVSTPATLDPSSDRYVFAQAALALRRTFHQTHAVPSGPVRGSCRIMGMLHLSGTAGQCHLLVQGDFLPINNVWVGMNVQIYSLGPNVIRPKEKASPEPQLQQMEVHGDPPTAPHPSRGDGEGAEGSPPSRPPDISTEDSTRKPPSPSPKEEAEETSEKPQKGESPPKGPTAEDG